MNTQTETPNRTCCMATPPIIFLFVTLLVTTGTTALLCGAIMSDHWENVTWDRMLLEKLTHNTTNVLEWQLDGRAAVVTVQRESDVISPPNVTNFIKQFELFQRVDVERIYF